MADRITLKSYFEAGDKPTQAQFAELIDSLALLTEIPSLASVPESIAGTNNTKSISPYLLAQVLADRLINNLTAGGTNKILSAEQGKILQNFKADKTYNLNTTERGSWKTGLEIGKEIVRSGVAVGSTIPSSSSGSSFSFPNQFFATIPSFSLTAYSVIFSVYVVNYSPQTSWSFPATQRLEGQLTHFTDSMLRVQYDYIARSTNTAHYPITPYMSWEVIKH